MRSRRQLRSSAARRFETKRRRRTLRTDDRQTTSARPWRDSGHWPAAESRTPETAGARRACEALVEAHFDLLLQSRATVLRRFHHIHLEAGTSVLIALRRNHENQPALELHFHVPHIGTYGDLFDRFTPEPRHRGHDPPQIL